MYLLQRINKNTKYTEKEREFARHQATGLLNQARQQYITAIKAMQEIRFLENSYDTYVIRYEFHSQSDWSGLTSTLEQDLKKEREHNPEGVEPEAVMEGKIAISINPSLPSLKDRIITLGHEVVHAMQYEEGKIGLLYGSDMGRDPTYEITDEVAAFQREKDLWGQHKHHNITSQWVANRHYKYGILANTRKPNVDTNTMTPKKKTIRELWSGMYKNTANAGGPLYDPKSQETATILYKGWQIDYLEQRFIRGHGLSLH